MNNDAGAPRAASDIYAGVRLAFLELHGML